MLEMVLSQCICSIFLNSEDIPGSLQSSPFRYNANLLVFCCLMEFGVGNGSRPMHLQYLPYAGELETGKAVGILLCREQ